MRDQQGRVMRGLLILVLAMAAPIASGGPPDALHKRTYHGTVSGEILLRNYTGPTEPSTNQSIRSGEIVDREMARGYMDGVKDATEGEDWCYVSGKPHTLNDEIADSLAKLNREELKARAAPLVVNALRNLYPCPTNGRKP